MKSLLDQFAADVQRLRQKNDELRAKYKDLKCKDAPVVEADTSDCKTSLEVLAAEISNLIVENSELMDKIEVIEAEFSFKIIAESIEILEDDCKTKVYVIVLGKTAEDEYRQAVNSPDDKEFPEFENKITEAIGYRREDILYTGLMRSNGNIFTLVVKTKKGDAGYGI